MFRSFFIAGFEGSTGINRHGRWFDHVVATGHDRAAHADYRAIADLGILAARESVRWPLVDSGRGRFDFSSVEPFVAASRAAGVEVVWDLFHYGYPAHVDLWHRSFPRRFSDYCYAVARWLRARTEGTLYFTPVNEPSFLAYAGGEKGLFAPHATGRGWDLKVALAQAAIAGIDAIRAVCPDARFVNVDPLCRVAPPADPAFAEEAQDFNERLVFQSWDMLAGRLLPELGGSPSHLDVVGINYYWTNQWEWRIPLVDGRVPPLAEDDCRRASLGDLVRGVLRRYGGEVVITETSHVGERRGPWMVEAAAEAEALLAAGAPLRGMCLYPVLGMPEWHEPETWTLMGLWDPARPEAGCNERIACAPMIEAVAASRDRLDALHRRNLARAEKAARLGDLTPAAARLVGRPADGGPSSNDNEGATAARGDRRRAARLF